MTKRKQFWSTVSVFVPGNFVSVHIGEFSGRRRDYTVVNQDAFLAKFCNVTRHPMLVPGVGIVHNHPFAMPIVELKEEYKGVLKSAEFLIRKISRKEEYEISLDTVRVANTTFEVKKI